MPQEHPRNESQRSDNPRSESPRSEQLRGGLHRRCHVRRPALQRGDVRALLHKRPDQTDGPRCRRGQRERIELGPRQVEHPDGEERLQGGEPREAQRRNLTVLLGRVPRQSRDLQPQVDRGARVLQPQKVPYTCSATASGSNSATSRPALMLVCRSRIRPGRSLAASVNRQRRDGQGKLATSRSYKYLI